MPTAKALRFRHFYGFARCISLALILTFVSIAGPALSASKQKYAADQIIVRVRPGKSAEFASLNKAVGAKVKRDMKRIGYVSLRLPKGLDLEKALEKYRSHPAIEYAGPNYIFHVLVEPNDPCLREGYDLMPDFPGYFLTAPQWGLYNDGINYEYPTPLYGTAGVDIDAFSAWEVFTSQGQSVGSSSVIIAVIDTGIDYYHEDFVNSNGSSKIWTNTDETPNNGIDDDNNGYVDDVQGWNFFANTPNAMDVFVDPLSGLTIHHGTFVSGIAGAATDNGIGIAGVAWNCPIMPLKVVEVVGDEELAYEDDIAAAVDYAVDNGSKVINISLGLEAVPYPALLGAAVDDAWARGAICVCAAGNDEGDLRYYPASFVNSLAVGAMNTYGIRCSPSDWGAGGGSTYGDFMDVTAPGHEILSLTDMYYEGAYGTLPGTSAAAPHVAGIAALIWSRYPNWTNQQVVEQIKHTAIDITSDPAAPPGANLTGWDKYTGWGRVNAYLALTQAVQLPVQSLAEVKHMTVGARVIANGKFLSTATGQLANRLYIQESDRSSGIMLYFTGTVPTGYVVGDKVDVDGVVGKFEGECAIMNPVIQKSTPAANVVPKPVGMSGKILGGGDMGEQTGVLNYWSDPREMGIGLNNVGLLVTVCGKVKKPFTGSSFYIDDGSNLEDDEGNTGVYVYCGTLTREQEGKYVAITGISSCKAFPAPNDFLMRKVLRPRVQADIRKFN